MKTVGWWNSIMSMQVNSNDGVWVKPECRRGKCRLFCNIIAQPSNPPKRNFSEAQNRSSGVAAKLFTKPMNVSAVGIYRHFTDDSILFSFDKKKDSIPENMALS